MEQNKIYIDGDFNHSYEHRVRNSKPKRGFKFRSKAKDAKEAKPEKKESDKDVPT